LEVGIGASSGFAKLDFDALGIPFGTWKQRFADYAAAVERLLELTGPASPLGAQPVQSPLPLILGGASEEVRQLAIMKSLAWTLSSASADEFERLKQGQPDPQAQVFMKDVASVGETVARFREAGATRLVFVLEPPIAPGDITRLARKAGL
jgi:alkanesulfonate monooxygenase SsuD/methylene tetrahydromethanopterin reductase-like flavin-dependent oxidoreductase (luciferase family)